MSKYREIKTEFRNPTSLKKALDEMGVKYEASLDARSNSITLWSNWKTWGGESQAVAIAIQKDEASRVGLGCYDGVGFHWNGSSYDLVADHMDENLNSVVSQMNKLRQSYAKQEIRRQAYQRGYGVQEDVGQDGVIRMTLVRR